MPMPLRQSLRVGSYLMRQKLAGNKKFPLLVELELLQPAASRIEPTAAAAATIAFDARKMKPSHAAPSTRGHALASWLDKSHLG